MPDRIPNDPVYSRKFLILFLNQEGHKLTPKLRLVIESVLMEAIENSKYKELYLELKKETGSGDSSLTRLKDIAYRDSLSFN